MPIRVACPACSATLTAPDAAGGKTVKCPKCQTAMMLPAADPPPVTVVRPVAARPVAPPPTPVSRPAPSRADDDDDDRPRKKRRRDDDDDDEDDRPRSRRDEDDEDDRPVKKSKKGKKSKKKAGKSPVALIVGGVTFLVFAVGAFFLVQSLMGGGKQKIGGGGGVGLTGGGGDGSITISTTPAVAAPAGWITQSPPGSGVTVTAPGQLASFNPPGIRQPGLTIKLWQTQSEGMVYTLSQITSNERNRGSQSKMLDDVCQGFLSTAGLGVPVNRTTIQMAGNEGRQMEFITQGRSVFVRVTVVGQTVHNLNVAGPAPLVATDPNVAGFLDSFKLGGS